MYLNALYVWYVLYWSVLECTCVYQHVFYVFVCTGIYCVLWSDMYLYVLQIYNVLYVYIGIGLHWHVSMCNCLESACGAGDNTCPMQRSVKGNVLVCITGCPSWQWHRTGYSWSPVQILPVAPLWCDLGRCSRTVVVIKLRWNSALQYMTIHTSMYWRWLK